MNLVVALFFGILLFLLAGYLRQSHGICVAGAAMAHFSWLVAFAWMTVLSVSVARTLSAKLARPNRRRGIDRAFVVYTCVAYGIPLIIVSICLTLQFCECTDLSAIYAEGGICWITDATFRVATFVVPVGLSLALNIAMYVLAVVQFRRSRHASKVARDEGTADAIKEELTVYLKVRS